MFAEFFVLLSILSTCFWIWQKQHYAYWQRLNVKFITPLPLFGNVKPMLTMQQSYSEQIATLYNTKAFRDEPLIGFYLLMRPALLIRDLQLIKRVMITDFNSFPNRFWKPDPYHDPLGTNNLFFLRNPKWREARRKLSPIYSTGKVKQMYPLMVEIAKELETLIATIPPTSAILDIKELSMRFTTDLIATTAFGVQAHSLKDTNSEFFHHNKAIFNINLKRAVELVISILVPALAPYVRVKIFTKNTSDFIMRSIKHVMDERERSGCTRNDLVDTLIAMKKEALASPDQENPANDFGFLAAQAAVFQTAGFETSSSAMAFALFELAMQPQLLERLRDEIKTAFEESDDHEVITYEKIQELQYLSQVINETLRLYPVVAFLERECSSTAKTDEGYSLKPYCDAVLPDGTAIYISPLAIQRDEKYWPNALKFDPDRFAPENRAHINWDAYMPFGLGPHNCIGMRIGLLQAKLGLVHLLKHHRVVKCDQTPDSIAFHPKGITLCSKSPIFLKLERVDSSKKKKKIAK